MGKTAFRHDSELLEALQGSDSEREHALQHFFENPRLLPWVLRHVRLQGGSEQDGKDVFEESFLIFERQVRMGHFRGESTLETYFHGIARWQWLAFRRKNRPTTDFETQLEMPSEDCSPEKILISEERRVILSGLMAQVGERCQKLLGLFQLNYSMREIREQMGFASDQVAANEVHGCREKLKKIIQKHPESLDALQNRT
ncbi:MAG: RNA polymerase sigma factor [Saprospiraceae bacterium]